ncbi:hypothetical protein P152DRAFT_454092 [Eremomyces bilateralis CBS 781.70]|uniref:FAM192A/Fyv6 N-terminal domain-containing protein n=1 Tax=Eremomyces bilateralis CBS 781.70 TaxID=1392243 RepID=A0A6G1GHP4_9PEZI|nr:uncharacterized protein P152DRAFT_454092 [Eremomyces bilateralis CBS 781.70]KAF1817502.1 hypothetical protein P152DRAFT_454092 [Eremomyces bilateralis CBS 781.70]
MADGNASRFVSGGTIDAPIDRDDEWKQAQQELEEARRKKFEQEQQQDGRSLYEVLEANKAAKQEAFEEAARLKNQFRSLDDDEVDFLDSVLESTRAKEAEVKKETVKQLEAFRRQREEAERSVVVSHSPENAGLEEEHWSGARKRKKTKDKEGFRGLKLRKTSSDTSSVLVEPKANEAATRETVPSEKTLKNPVVVDTTRPAEHEHRTSQISTAQGQPKSQSPSTVQSKGLGLAEYSSDDD